MYNNNPYDDFMDNLYDESKGFKLVKCKKCGKKFSELYLTYSLDRKTDKYMLMCSKCKGN